MYIPPLPPFFFTLASILPMLFCTQKVCWVLLRESSDFASGREEEL